MRNEGGEKGCVCGGLAWAGVGTIAFRALAPEVRWVGRSSLAG